jgi:hypothetical protein
MLKINKGEPWVMWPNNLVTKFIDFPANRIFDHEGDFVFTMVFELVEPITEKSSLLAKLPSYFGIDLLPNGCNFIYSYKDTLETYHSFNEYSWDVNRRYILVIKKEEDKLTLSINDLVIVELSLSFDLAQNDNSHIVFGAGNFPKNGFNLNYFPYIIHYLTIEKDGELISEHKFEEFIHGKSFDLTDNCNFLYKI